MSAIIGVFPPRVSLRIEVDEPDSMVSSRFMAEIVHDRRVDPDLFYFYFYCIVQPEGFKKKRALWHRRVRLSRYLGSLGLVHEDHHSNDERHEEYQQQNQNCKIKTNNL